MMKVPIKVILSVVLTGTETPCPLLILNIPLLDAL
jgi:hypothetical protein